MTSNNPVFYISGEKSYYVPELNAIVDDGEDIESLYEYDRIYNNDASISAECKVDRMMLYKICGVYDFIIKYCPNKKVVHLINHGKNERIRNKNFKRGLMIINRMVTKNNWMIKAHGSLK